MRLFCLRELGLMARSPALGISAGVHAGVLAAFLLLWGDGMPGLHADTVYEQLRFIQSVLLAILLPWAAARCAANERGNQLVMIAAATATPPSRVVLGQCAGRFAALLAVAAAGLPLAVVAQQASAVALTRVLYDAASLIGVCGVVSVLTSWWIVVSAGRVGNWVWPGLLTVMLCWMLPPNAVTGLWLFPAITAFSAMALGAWADSRVWYLDEGAVSS